MSPEPPLPSRYYALLIICCGVVLGCYFGTYMRFPVVPLFAQSLGADTIQVGMINAAFLLAAGVLSLPLGLAAHRLGLKRLALVGLLMLAVSSFLLAVSSTPHQLIWIYLFSGAGLAAFGPITMLYVANLAPSTHLGRAYGWYTTALYVGMSLGPAAGGFSAQAWGFPAVFVISGLSLLLVFVAMLLFLPRARKVMTVRPGQLPPARTVVREVWRNRPLLGSWLATAGACFGLGLFLTYLPLHAHALGLTYAQIGLIFAVQGAMNAISRLPFGSVGDRVRHRSYLVFLGLLGIAASLVGYGLSRQPLQFYLVAVAMGLSMGLAFTSVAALSVETVSPLYRGLAMGGYNSSIYLGMMASSAGLGPVLGRLGYAPGFLLAALLTLLLAGASFLLMRSFSRPQESRP
jgi:MFS transporter, DHA1 family, multidrug resistance protein